VDRPVGTLASPAPLPLPQRTLLRSFRQGYVRVAGIEDGAWGAVGRGHMAAGPACRYLFQTAWSKESCTFSFRWFIVLKVLFAGLL
jgi:hypothetical protein